MDQHQVFEMKPAHARTFEHGERPLTLYPGHQAWIDEGMRRWERHLHLVIAALALVAGAVLLH